MMLTGIQLRQFRQFRAGLQMDGLTAGINLFHGPNESGKSTLVQAIRAAFFERHNTGTLGHLQPWGDSAAAPEVSLSFTFGGQQYRLEKRFMHRGRCHLTIGQRQLDGDEAEQYLASMLGYSMPGRGASQARNQGVPGLLWIEQGSGQELHTSVAHAAPHLQGILNEAMGQVASTDGDGVMHRVKERLAMLVTPATGVPTREYKKAMDEAQRLQQELTRLDEAIAAYAQQVDRLAVLQAEHRRADSEKPWLALRQHEESARKQLDAVQALVVEQQRERDAMQVSQKTRQLLQERLQGMAAQRDAVRQRQDALARARERNDSLTAQSEGLQQSVDSARQAYAAARARLAQSRQYQQHRDKRDALAQTGDEITALTRRLEQARHTQESLDSRHRLAAQLITDAATLGRLTQLTEKRRVMEIRQQTAATRVSFELEPGQSVSVGNERIEGNAEKLLTAETAVSIPGVGQLRIAPGGDDIASLARQLQSLDDEIGGCLGVLNVQSLEQALSREARHKEVQATIRQDEAVLALHAPDGIAMLQRRLQALQDRHETLQSECQALDGYAVEVADANVAEAQEREAEAQLASHETTLQEHKVSCAAALTALETAERELALAQAAVRDTQYPESREEMLAQLHHEAAQQQILQQRIDAVQKRIDAVRPDILEQDIERYARSAAREYEAHAERERNVRELRARLQALGAQGLEEQRAERARQSSATARRIEAFQGNVAALRLLHSLLHQKKQAFTRQLHAPLTQRLQHYLCVLFDTDEVGASISLGEDLAPAGLTRSGGSAPLHELSFGAREQMGTISRLAYADLLKQAGKPTLIMLDDALVHSDEHRLAQMKRILFDASQRHQILLFTCQPDRWRDLGAAPRAIDDYRL